MNPHVETAIRTPASDGARIRLPMTLWGDQQQLADRVAISQRPILDLDEAIRELESARS